MSRSREHDGIVFRRKESRAWWIRYRDRQRVRIKTALGIRERNVLQPATVHQEFRVLRRMLNVAVRKRLLPANPCSGSRISRARKRPFPTALC